MYMSTQILSCRGSRIAPYDRMNVTVLVYADNALYQICTIPTIKSHCPDKGTVGTILVAAVQGSAHLFRWYAKLFGSLRFFKFQCEARGESWQVTRQKNVDFCQEHDYEVHTNMTNMQKYAPRLWQC